MRTREIIDVLLLGPLPPGAGITTVMQSLLSSDFGDGIRVSAIDTKSNRTQRFGGAWSPLSALSVVRCLVRFLWRGIFSRPAIIQIESGAGTSFLKNSLFVRIANLLGIKSILSIHGAGFDEYYHSLPWRRQRYVRSVLMQCTRVRALSRGWSDFLRDSINLPEDGLVELEVAPV